MLLYIRQFEENHGEDQGGCRGRQLGPLPWCPEGKPSSLFRLVMHLNLGHKRTMNVAE